MDAPEGATTAESGEGKVEAISVCEADERAANAATGGDSGGYSDYLACANSLSDPAERDEESDRLFCAEKQEYVAEDACCTEFYS